MGASCIYRYIYIFVEGGSRAIFSFQTKFQLISNLCCSLFICSRNFKLIAFGFGCRAIVLIVFGSNFDPKSKQNIHQKQISVARLVMAMTSVVEETKNKHFLCDWNNKCNHKHQFIEYCQF